MQICMALFLCISITYSLRKAVPSVRYRHRATLFKRKRRHRVETINNESAIIRKTPVHLVAPDVVHGVAGDAKPCPPTGFSSICSSNAAIRGRPRLMASFTGGSERDA